MISKEHCAQYLAHRFHAASDWRRCQANKFTDDKRNAKAAEKLLELASQIEIPDTIWSKIAPYFNEEDTRWLSAVSDTNRDIGFRKHPSDFAAYLQQLAANLTRH